MASSTTLDGISAAVVAVAPSYDISRVYLFGSCARGDQHDDSDVDLCLETGAEFSLFSAGGFADDLQHRLGVPVDIVTERSCYPHVRENMLKERVLLYER